MSFVTSLDVCATHAAFMIKEMEAKGREVIDAKQSAEDAYCEMIYILLSSPVKVVSVGRLRSGRLRSGSGQLSSGSLPQIWDSLPKISGSLPEQIQDYFSPQVFLKF